MKKVFSLLLTLCLLLSLAACGGNNSSGSNDGGSDTDAGSNAGTDAPAPAASGDTIKIGLYATITGTNALAGEMAEKGARLALKEINEAGGVNGQMLELVVYDDKSTPEGAVRAVTRMVDSDHVTAIVGSNSSPNIVAASQITEDAGVLQVGCGTSPSYTNAGYQYIFRGTANANLPNAAFVDAMEKTGAQKIAILSIASENGVSGVNSTKDLMPASMEVVCEEQYQPTDTDFTGQIAKIIASGADSVILYGTTSDSALAIKQLRSNGYNGFIYGPEALGVPDIINVGGEAAENVIFGSGAIIPATIDDAANEVEKAMLTAFVEEYGEMPVSDVVYRGYDSAKIIAIALQNASDINNPDAVREAVLGITDYEGIAGTYNFSDGSGDGLNTARAYIINGGKNVLFSDWLADNPQ